MLISNYSACAASACIKQTHCSGFRASAALHKRKVNRPMQPVPRTTSQKGSFQNIKATKAIKPSPKSCGLCNLRLSRPAQLLFPPRRITGITRTRPFPTSDPQQQISEENHAQARDQEDIGQGEHEAAIGKRHQPHQAQEPACKQKKPAQGSEKCHLILRIHASPRCLRLQACVSRPPVALGGPCPMDGENNSRSQHDQP
jgi:hypothetical protein